MSTIHDVAREAGTSVAAVSYALNGHYDQISAETCELILQTAERLNYKPNRMAKSLRMKKTHVLGVVVEDIMVFNSPDIINGIGAFAQECGYGIILNNLRLYKRFGARYIDHDLLEQRREEVSKILNKTLDEDVDGYIYIGGHIRDVTGIIDLKQKPVVYTYCYSTDDGTVNIIYNDEQVGYNVTKALIDKGHKKIMAITGPDDSEPSNKRLLGYRRAMEENGLSVDGFILHGNWEIESGAECVREFLKMKDRPTGVFAFNDLMAVGFLKACNQNNIKVPEDVSIIGCDDNEYCKFVTPEMSSVKHPLYEMGKTAAKKLIQLVENDSSLPESEELSCEVILRDSVSEI